MKTLLSITVAAMLLPLFCFADSPTVRNAFSTNATPIAVNTVRGAINGTTGTGNAMFNNQPLITLPNIQSGVTWDDNTRITFPAATPGVAGLNVGSIAGDPTSFANGDLWYNSSLGALRARIAAATVSLGVGTVTSIASSFPPELTLTSSSPITGSGTITYTWTAQAANRVFAGPTSGSSATPAFRALVPLDIPTGITVTSNTVFSAPAFLTQLGYRFGQTTYGNSTTFTYGMSYTTSGTLVNNAPTATQMGATDAATSSTINSQAAINSGLDTISGHAIICTVTAAPTNLTSVRVFLGLGSPTFPNMVTSAIGSIAQDFIGFSYEDGVDTKWQLVSRDASTAVVKTDTGVTPTTSLAVFQLIGVSGGAQWDAYINGTYVGTKTANLPRTTVVLRFGAAIQNTAANSKAIRVGLLSLYDKYP